MKKWLLVPLALVILGLPGCAAGPVEKETVQYYYDEAHNVSIWVLYTASGMAISVLPGSQVKSPSSPARITQP